MAEAETRSEPDVVTKVSPRSVRETVARFTDLLSAKGVRLFAVIDQAHEARQAGLELRETVLILFGNPKAGTPVMAASPLAALDLPLKPMACSRRGLSAGDTEPREWWSRFQWRCRKRGRRRSPWSRASMK